MRKLFRKVAAAVMLMCILAQTGPMTLASILSEERSSYWTLVSPPLPEGKKLKKALGKSKGVVPAEAPSLTTRFSHPVEGQPAKMIFELDRDAVTEVTFEVSTLEGGGSNVAAVGCDNPPGVGGAGEDCSYKSYSSHPMTIPAGSREVSLDIETYDNDTLDADRDFTVRIDNSSNASIDPSGQEKVVTILDRNGSATAPTLSVMRVVSHPIKGNAAVVRLELDRPAPANVIVYISTNDLTALGGSSCGTGINYILLDRLPVTINSGTQSREFYISTCSDDIVSGDKAFEVEIVDILGGVLPPSGLTNPVEVTIRDHNVHPVLTFTVDSPVTEGERSNLTFSLDKPAVGDVVFNYSTNGLGSAREGIDYDVAADVRVTIPEGRTTPSEGTIYAIQTHEGILGTSANFFIELSSFSDNVSYPVASATEIIITKSNVPAVLTVSVNPVIAGNAAVVEFSLDKAPTSDVAVTFYTEDDSAVSGVDYEGIASTSPETVTFTAADWSAQRHPINTVANGQTGAVQFKVKVGVPSDVTYTGGDVIAVINPPTTQGNLSMQSNATSVVGGGSFTLTFRLDQVLPHDVDFTVSTSGGTADPSTDYDGLTRRPVQIRSGELSATLTIATYAVANDVYFNVGVDAGSITGANDQSSELALNILNSTTAPLPSLTVLYPAGVYKGNSAALAFSLDQVPVNAVEFYVTTFATGTGAGHAEIGVDVEYLDNRRITIPANATTADLELWTAYTRPGENDLAFSVRIDNVQNASNNTNSPFSILIKDPVTGGLPVLTTSAPSEVIEGSAAVVTLSLDRSPLSSTSIRVRTIDGTASGNSVDYETTDMLVTFIPVGIPIDIESIQTFTTNSGSGNRFFEVSFESSEVEYTQGNRRITIVDDVPGLVPVLTAVATPNPVEEGNAVTVDFSISPVSSQSSVFEVKTADYTAQSGVNYTGVNTILTIPAGSSSPTSPVIINTLEDGIATGNLQFFIQMNPLSNVEYIDGDITVTITDKDSPVQPRILSITHNTTPVEGTDAVVTFGLTQPAPVGGVTFNVSTRPPQSHSPEARPGVDYDTKVNDAVTIPEGATSVTYSIRTFDHSSTADKWFNVMIVPGSITNAMGGSPIDVDVLIQDSNGSVSPTLRIAD